MMKGSVVFYKKDDKDFISKAVSFFENNGEFTHVAIVIDYNEETKVAKIIESNGMIKTRESSIVINNDHEIWAVEGLSDDIENKIVEYAQSKIGTSYDYWQIVGLAISLTFSLLKRDDISFFNNKNKFICSELVDMAYHSSGVNRNNNDNIGNVTPQELLGEYKFIKISP